MSNSTLNLKPCPFCGAEMRDAPPDANYIDHPLNDCLLRGAVFEKGRKVKWNTRVAGSEISGDEVERVAAAIHNACAELDAPKGMKPAYGMNRNKEGWRLMAKAAIAAMSPKREISKVGEANSMCPNCGMDILLYNHPQPCPQLQKLESVKAETSTLMKEYWE